MNDVYNKNDNATDHNLHSSISYSCITQLSFFPQICHIGQHASLVLMDHIRMCRGVHSFPYSFSNISITEEKKKRKKMQF